MKDRFTRGFLSGIIAGVPTLAFALIAFSLKWTNIRWAHFASILIFGRKFINLQEDIFSSFAVFFFCGLMGAIFAFIIMKISSQNYLLKGWVYSLSIWFFAFAVTSLFKVPQLPFRSFNAALSNFIAATIWGLSLGYCLHWFDNRLKLNSRIN